MTPPESGDPSGMTLSELIETLMRDRWAGAHALRGEYPRLVVIPADEFASYSATVDRRHQIVVVAAGAGEADVVYVCIKNAANAYVWVDVSNGFEPIGTIKLYVGALADIPSGWYVCDGSNGTPDLRGYFILGSSLAGAGQADAGASTVIAAHANHAVTQPANHTWAPANTGTPDSGTTVTDDGTSQVVVSTSTHLHGFDPADAVHSGGAVDAHSSHVVSQDYSPPSYTLALIMKVS